MNENIEKKAGWELYFVCSRLSPLNALLRLSFTNSRTPAIAPIQLEDCSS